MTNTNPIKLRCSFQDEQDEKIFVIEVCKEDKVTTLESAVKILLANQGYQVLFLSFDLYVENKLIESTKEISKYFDKPPVQDQHMIKTLFCLVHGNPLKVMFSIDVDANDTIMSVREIIEKKIYIPDNMRAKDLTLWKVNVLYNKDAIQVPDNYIHIMVEISNIVTVRSYYDLKYNSSKFQQLLNFTGLTLKNIEFSGRILEENIASYNWTSHAKNHLDQRRKVLKYFKDNLKCHPPTEIIIEDVSNNKHLLDIPKLSCLPFSVNSRTDLVLVERNYIKSKMFRTGIHAIIELKKKLEDRDFRQAILEMIVADILTKCQKVIGVKNSSRLCDLPAESNKSRSKKSPDIGKSTPPTSQTSKTNQTN
ncbi:11294_t:CDS:2, partial [Funneliformis geosporum]